MEMTIRLAGGGRVDAFYRDQSIATAQDGSAPAPFELFLASIGTCAGLYVARFCEERSIPPEGVTIRQNVVWNAASRRVDRIEIDIVLPDGFPERYRDAVVRAARTCAVKQALESPPEITVRTVASEGARA